MKKYRCPTCDYVYDPAVGDPEADIPPGTAFEDLPDDWVCPDCGEPKEEFELIDEQPQSIDIALLSLVRNFLN